MTAKAPQFFPIPAGTRRAHCASCAQPIYWILTAADKRMPVSLEYPGAFTPANDREGSGISHFVDCPERDKHRRAR